MRINKLQVYAMTWLNFMNVIWAKEPRQKEYLLVYVYWTHKELKVIDNVRNQDKREHEQGLWGLWTIGN